MNAGKNGGNLNVPSIAWCPGCKRAMGIKHVRPGLRQNFNTIDYECHTCGASQQEHVEQQQPAAE